MPPENIGIIPARGGSKGVVGKNLRLLGGIPLIAYGILCSLKAASIHRTIVTSDSHDILDVARKYGAEAILRPQELATDSSPTEPAMQHVVRTLEARGIPISHIALIQCTCPFRLSSHIEEGFALIRQGNGDAVMSVSSVPAHFHPCWLKRISPEGGHLESFIKEPDIQHPILETQRYWRRQDLPGNYFWKNGALYIMSYHSLMVDGHRYGTRCAPLMIDSNQLINIDSEDDFRRAEQMLASGKICLDFLD